MNGAAERDRFRGCLLGLAAGRCARHHTGVQATRVVRTDRRHGRRRPRSACPGQWTDDTSMALCLATSLVECGGFDAADQMQRYVRWWREGYLSSTGSCFDIGNTVSAALSRFLRHGDPYAAPPTRTAPATVR